MNRTRPLLGGLILVYFVIGLEVLVMISPFAGFFYAAFDPALRFLGRFEATGWLVGFFLPHMISPPGLLLRSVRVAGSVLFLVGAVAFLVSAGLVYGSKLARRGPVLGGPYRFIRHPQYLALAVTGLGLAILWPRFLTAALWAAMAALYYALARDEERRMVARFGEVYRAYQARTGMFLPRLPGRGPATPGAPGPGWARALAGVAALFALSVGGALALRDYTVSRLPVFSMGPVAALPVLQGDEPMVQHRLAAALGLPELRGRLPEGAPVLVYVVPVDYVMQGMIADTGPEWRLYQRHRTMAMLADWVLHPFRHLEGGHGGMHLAGGVAPAAGESSWAVRRLIFVRVETPGDETTPEALLGLSAPRRPMFFADVNLHELRVLRLQDLGPGTGFGNVPTPLF